jgi:single-strand DNA-binding protein
MQKIIISGNVGTDAATRNVNAQRDVINFNVACNEKWTDAQGVQQSRTTWYNCAYFRPVGKTGIAQYIKKGGKVLITGTPSARSYTDKNGTVVASLDINVQEIELMGDAHGGQAQPNPALQQAQQNVAANQFAPQDDDLPF